jgi:choline dehydrogenase-like flavoprotein
VVATTLGDECVKPLTLNGAFPDEEIDSHSAGSIADELELIELHRHARHEVEPRGKATPLRIPRHAPALVVEAGLFTRSAGAAPRLPPDLQYIFGPLQFIEPEYRTSSSGFTFTPTLLRPSSRGRLSLASRDPHVPARIDLRYLSTEHDIDVLGYGVRYARELAHTRPFEALRGRELAPGSRVRSKAELRSYIRKVAGTVWHPCGTCRMGTGPDAVVDAQLRVHGIAGLRIADASIMPRLVSGNPNAAVMMIAEKAAELIAPQLCRQSSAASPGTRRNSLRFAVTTVKP